MTRDLVPESSFYEAVLDKTTWEICTRPFEDDEHEQRKIGGNSFTYVKPHSYRKRFSEAFPQGYEFAINEIKLTPDYFYGTARFMAQKEAVDGEPAWTEYRTVAFAEPLSNRPMAQIDQILQSANSAALKSIGRELGMGLYLYEPEFEPPVDNAPQQAATPTKTYAPKPQASQGPRPTTPKATGDVVPFGKHKGTPWTQVDAGWLSWVISTMADKPDLQAKAQGELDRRSGAAVQQAQANAYNSVDAELEGEIPF